MKSSELLEAAAKSIDLTLRYDYLGGRDANQPWNPIEDNGDAMALAIARNLQVDPGSDKRGFAVVRTPGDNWKEFREPHGDDKEAAVRLTITRAAAGTTRENEASGGSHLLFGAR